jgi:hypothetical protein
MFLSISNDDGARVLYVVLLYMELRQGGITFFFGAFNNDSDGDSLSTASNQLREENKCTTITSTSTGGHNIIG